MRLRFLVDHNVGRLAKWLRVLGYDTLFDPQLEDAGLLRVAAEEHRVLLTKDSGILHRRVVASGRVRTLWVRSDNPWEQLHQVVEELQLSGDAEFSRCIICNEPLTPVGRERVQQRVPPYVYRAHKEFMECSACRRIYWRGTHWKNMQAELAQIKRGMT